MDNDLLTVWLRADLMSESEARDLITELQEYRDSERGAVKAIREAFDELCAAGIDDISERVGKLGEVIEEWE